MYANNLDSTAIIPCCARTKITNNKEKKKREITRQHIAKHKNRKMTIFSKKAQKSLLKADLLHFHESCNGKTAEDMIHEARNLYNSVLTKFPEIVNCTRINAKSPKRIPEKHVQQTLKEVHSLLTKSLFILFESTLPSGFFSGSGSESKRKGKAVSTNELIQNNGVRSMKSETTKFALQLRFATENSSATRKDQQGGKGQEGVESRPQDVHNKPLFSRETYEKLSIETYALRSRVSLLMGHPFQALIDAENALFFCHRLSVELGEIDKHCELESIFSVLEPGKIDLISLYCAQRVQVNGLLQILRTISEAYHAMKSYQNAFNFALLHEHYLKMSFILGEDTDEKEIDSAYLRAKVVEVMKKIQTELKKRHNDASIRDQILNLLHELHVPREELLAMEDSTTSFRTFETDKAFTEDELHAAGGIYEEVMKNAGAKDCQIKDTPGMGLGIIATKNIERGTKVCQDDLLVSANYKHQLQCDRCLTPITKRNGNRKKGNKKKNLSLYTPPCMHQVYCGEHCAMAAETQYHKQLCHLWPGVKAMFEWSSQGNSGFSKTHCSLVRLWAMKRSAPKNYRYIHLLNRDSIIHITKFLSVHAWAEKNSLPMLQFSTMFQTYIKNIPTLARDPMFDLRFFLTHLSMLSRYTFSANGGSLLNLGGSFFNHSCNPNVERNDEQQCFVAKRKIMRGEQLFISYVHEDDVFKRSVALLQYGFRCNCSRCLRERRTDKRDQHLIHHFK